MELSKNVESAYYEDGQQRNVIEYAIKLADAGRLRDVFDSGKEIGYWYAPEVKKGKPTICANKHNPYKTVSLSVKKHGERLTDPEYKQFMNELYDYSQSIREDDTELFSILASGADNKWVVALDGRGKPYTYTSFEAATRSINRLAKVEEAKEMPDVYAYKVLKYQPVKPSFDGGSIIENFYALKTDDGRFIGERLEPINSFAGAATFDSSLEGELSARALADELNVHLAYFETRQMWVEQ